MSNKKLFVLVTFLTMVCLFIIYYITFNFHLIKLDYYINKYSSYSSKNDFCFDYILLSKDLLKPWKPSFNKELYTNYQKRNILVKFDKELESCIAYNKITKEIEYWLFVGVEEILDVFKELQFENKIKEKFE